MACPITQGGHKRKKIEETTGQKYNGVPQCPITQRGRNKICIHIDKICIHITFGANQIIFHTMTSHDIRAKYMR